MAHLFWGFSQACWQCASCWRWLGKSVLYVLWINLCKYCHGRRKPWTTSVMIMPTWCIEYNICFHYVLLFCVQILYARNIRKWSEKQSIAWGDAHRTVLIIVKSRYTHICIVFKCPEICVIKVLKMCYHPSPLIWILLLYYLFLASFQHFLSPHHSLRL